MLLVASAVFGGGGVVSFDAGGFRGFLMTAAPGGMIAGSASGMSTPDCCGAAGTCLAGPCAGAGPTRRLKSAGRSLALESRSFGPMPCRLREAQMRINSLHSLIAVGYRLSEE